MTLVSVYLCSGIILVVFLITIPNIASNIVCLFVSLYVSSELHLVRFGQLLRCPDKRIVNIMKV